MKNKELRKILFVDLKVRDQSPAGSLVKSLVINLSADHSINVITSESDLDVERAAKVSQVRIPTWPLLLRYFLFSWRAATIATKWRKKNCHQVVIATQGQDAFADIQYAHYCHRWYLSNAFSKAGGSGPRRWIRWLNHYNNARDERQGFSNAKLIVAVSTNLADEISTSYGDDIAKKITVIHNPVNVNLYSMPPTFNKQQFRQRLGFPERSQIAAFVALGDFERKGLKIVLEAAMNLRQEGHDIWLLLVGTTPDKVESLVAASGFSKEHLIAVGRQADVRPYLWVSDAFCLPSTYETASLVMLEARAAGLPLVVTEVGYALPLVDNGHGGVIVERTPSSVFKGLKDVLEPGQSWGPIPPGFDVPAFHTAWRNVIRQVTEMSS